MRSYNPVYQGHAGQIKKAVQLILGSQAADDLHRGRRRYSSDAAARLTELVRMLGFPCTNTLMGSAVIPPPTDSLSACWECMAPTKPTWRCSIATCWWPSAPVSMIASSAIRKHFFNEIARSSTSTSILRPFPSDVKVDVPIVGNVTDVLDELHQTASRRARKSPTRQRLTAWWAQIDAWRDPRLSQVRPQSAIIKPQMVIEKLYRSDERRMLSLPRTWASIRCGRRNFTSSTCRGDGSIPADLGTMGFGLPAAMGVQFANPGRRSRALLAKPASRCASRSCRPASNITFRSRSSI